MEPCHGYRFLCVRWDLILSPLTLEDPNLTNLLKSLIALFIIIFCVVCETAIHKRCMDHVLGVCTASQDDINLVNTISTAHFFHLLFLLTLFNKKNGAKIFGIFLYKWTKFGVRF